MPRTGRRAANSGHASEMKAPGPGSGTTHLLSVFVLAVLLLSGPAAAQTGWYLMTDGEDSGVRYVREVLIADGKIKELPRGHEGTWVVYDVNRGEIAFVDPAREAYAQATPAAHCRALADQAEGLEDIVQLWSSGQPASTSSGQQAASSSPPVTVRDRGSSKTRLQDFEEALYEIRVDNQRYQMIWLTADARLLGELGGMEGLAIYVDMAHEFGSCSRELLGAAADVNTGTMRAYVESTPAYLDLMRKGWPLSTVWSLDGREVTEIVTIVSEWEVRSSDLEPPDSYRKLSLAEFLGIGGQ